MVFATKINYTSLCSASYVHWQRDTARILLSELLNASCAPNLQQRVCCCGPMLGHRNGMGTGHPHVGANGVSWPPGEMDEKLKSDNMQKRAVFWIYWEQSGQAGVENGAMLTTIYSDLLQNAPFRSQIFKTFFALGGKGALTPLTKILRTRWLGSVNKHKTLGTHGHSKCMTRHILHSMIYMTSSYCYSQTETITVSSL